MQPSDSLPPVGRGSGRPWPVAYPVPRATRRKTGLPGAWAVLFQRAVGSDPAGCASRLAHRVETTIAFRLHNALGTQNERYFVAVNPTAHSLACLRIGVFVTADAARLATGVGGSPFTGRVSHPLDGKQSFMTSPHRHSPLTSLAWSHCAPTPQRDAAAATRLFRKALTDPAHPQPRVINTDQARLYASAIAGMKKEGSLRRRCRHRPVQYVNNIVEQDHRAIKRRVNAKQGFREFQAARRTIQGYETMHMIRKGQARWVSGSDIRRQIHFINKLFEVAA